MLERWTSDWPLKLLALLLAIGIWVGVTGEERTLKDFTVPLEIQLGEQRVFASLPPTAVTVRLAGTENRIRRLDPLRLAVQLELQDGPPGEREVQLSEAQLTGVPSGVQVLLFTPDRVKIALDRRLRRELPVSPELIGTPPEGSYLYGLLVRPETLVVEGPESEVHGMNALRTDPIQLDGRARSFVASVAAIPDSPLVRVIDPRPIEVRAVIDVPPVEVTFGNVPVSLSDPGLDASVQPTNLRVTVSGPAALLSRVTKNQIRAVADTSQLDPGTDHVLVAIEVSIIELSQDQLARVRVKSIQPSEVSIGRHERSTEKP